MSLSRREFLHLLAVAAAAGLPLASRRALAGEASVNIGVGESANQPPHLVGQAFLRRYGFKPGSAEAYAFTSLDFAQAAKIYGKVGGFAHLATLVKRLRANRPHSLLLDGDRKSVV